MKYLCILLCFTLTGCAAGSFGSFVSLYSAHADVAERSKYSQQSESLTAQGEYELLKRLKYLDN